MSTKNRYLIASIVLIITGIFWNFWLADYIKGFYDMSEWIGSLFIVPATYCILRWGYFSSQQAAPYKILLTAILAALVSILIMSRDHDYDIFKSTMVIISTIIVGLVDYKQLCERKYGKKDC
jgi:uncharacterized membrane protein